MGIDLVKGQKIDLTKGNEGLTEILVGLGWDTNRYDSSSDFDLDCSVFLLNKDGLVSTEEDFIYYKNLTNGKGVTHTGDNLTGDGDGDDESVEIDFREVPDSVDRIVFVVTIYDAINRNQNFGQVDNSYIRVVDQATKEELVKFDLGEDFSTETAVNVAEIYKHNGEWKFAAYGSGYNQGLDAFCEQYGLEVINKPE